MKISECYRVIDPHSSFDDQGTLYFEIVSGPYKGTIYRYTVVKLGDFSGDQLEFSFEYKIVVDPKTVDQSKHGDFTVFISNVLIHFMQQDGEATLADVE